MKKNNFNTIPIVLALPLFLNNCKAPSRKTDGTVHPAKVEIKIDSDKILTHHQQDSIVPRKLVVGFKDPDLFFYNWPDAFTLNYQGYPLNETNYTGPTRFEIRNGVEKVCSISAKLWNHAESLALDDSPDSVGKYPAYRKEFPNKRLSYSFETNGNGYGWIVNISELNPAFEKWLVTSFSDTINVQTDSLVSLTTCPFPLQVPQAVQMIGVSFRMEAYHDDSFPRTKKWMRITNFSNLMTNKIMIADVVGSVGNITDGKPAFNKGDKLILKNYYAGLSKQWILINEGSRLALYEKTEDEPSINTEENHNKSSKELFVFQIPEHYNFQFTGYFPMSE